MIIRIQNLRLRTYIGIYDWEQDTRQDVVINVEAEFNGSRAAETDDVADTVDYKAINKKIIAMVEGGRWQLVEKLVGDILNVVMEDQRIQRARVRVDKPGALRYTDSVSLEESAER